MISSTVIPSMVEMKIAIENTPLQNRLVNPKNVCKKPSSGSENKSSQIPPEAYQEAYRILEGKEV